MLISLNVFNSFANLKWSCSSLDQFWKIFAIWNHCGKSILNLNLISSIWDLPRCMFYAVYVLCCIRFIGTEWIIDEKWCNVGRNGQQFTDAPTQSYVWGGATGDGCRERGDPRQVSQWTRSTLREKGFNNNSWRARSGLP